MNTAKKPARIVVLVSGSGSNLQAILDHCQSGHISGDVIAVISNNPDAYGLKRAEHYGAKTAIVNHRDYDCREQYDAELANRIESYEPDLIVLAGFMRILTPGFVERFLGKMINIHPSLLPKYTGLNTHQRAIDAKDSQHGATVHFVTAELDGGPAIIQGRVTIDTQDAQQLAEKVITQVEHKIFPLAVQWFCEGRVKMTSQGTEINGELLPAQGFQYSV